LNEKLKSLNGQDQNSSIQASIDESQESQ